MTPAHTLAPLVSLGLFATLPLAAQTREDAAAIPRYPFDVGQKIVFEGNTPGRQGEQLPTVGFLRLGEHIPGRTVRKEPEHRPGARPIDDPRATAALC